MTAAPPERPVWVILPTYNEAENVVPMLDAVLREFDRHGWDGHALVVDDSSPDGTGELADGVAARDGRIEVLERSHKEGIGPAYRAGFRVALDRGAGLVVEMDCDFSHDPAALGELVRAASGADLVLGSRYVGGGGVKHWGLVRRAISRGGCWYARKVLGVRVHDLTGGFKCFRSEVLAAIPLDDVTSAGYAFQIELTYRALRAGYRVREIPIIFTERTRGQSKMSKRIVLEAALVVPRLRSRLAGTSPIAVAPDAVESSNEAPAPHGPAGPGG